MTALRAQRVGPHFVWGEFYDRRRQLPPPIIARRALRELVLIHLEPLRDRFGRCDVHSAYRTVATNRLVGGAPRSRHLYDLFPGAPAVDVSFARGTPAEWARAAEQRSPGGLGRYATHIHIDDRSGRARWTG